MLVATHSKPSRRALITGLSGFTGQYLAQQLTLSGYEVYGTDNRPEGAVDICNRNDVYQLISEIQPDVVAHLAAISFVAHGNVEEIYKVNVVGTRNLLEALANHDKKPTAILLASSANIYGNTDLDLINETVPPSPANDYAVSKLSMEFMARLWMDRLPIFITRPFNYTGIGQSQNFLLPKIVSHFQRKERVIELGNLDVERDFSDVRMVAEAYRKLLISAPVGKVFNICTGTGHTLRDVLKMMSDIAGYEIEVSVNPAFVRPNEVKRLVGDATLLTNSIGQLHPIALGDTLKWMYEASI